MAAVTHGVATYSEANATSYTSGSFTPAAGDLLVGMVAAVSTGVGTTTFSTSDGEAFDQVVEDATDNYIFVGTTLAAANSQTATFDTRVDAGTRCGIAVARISGMTLTGSAAVRQTKTASGNDAATPAATFDAAPLSGSVILAFLQVTSNASPVVTPPSGFTEGAEAVAATENGAIEYAYKDNDGPTTVTWGSGIAAGGVWVATIVELQPEPAAYSLSIDAATFSFSGQNVAVEYGHEVATDAASFGVSAQSVATEYGRGVEIAAASFGFSGGDITFTYEPATGLYILCEPASFAFSAQTVAVEYGREVLAAMASFSYGGVDASLESGLLLSANGATYGFTATGILFEHQGPLPPYEAPLPRKPGPRFNDRRFNEGGFRPLRK